MSEVNISTAEVLATNFAILKDDHYNANHGRPDARGTLDDDSIRAMAERSLLMHEPLGIAAPEWRVKQRLDLLSRGDRYIMERIREKQRVAARDYQAKREEEQRKLFTWTDDPRLSAIENEKRREQAMKAHMSSPFMLAAAQKGVQKLIDDGALSPAPSQTALEAECRAEIRRERPWLFAHLGPASDGGAAARTPSEPVHEVARRVLAGTTSHSAAARSAIDNPATVHKREEKSKAQLVDEITELTNELNKLVVALLEAYAKRGVEIAGSPRETQRQRAMTLARACLGFDPGEKRERFLAAIMRASGL